MNKFNLLLRHFSTNILHKNTPKCKNKINNSININLHKQNLCGKNINNENIIKKNNHPTNLNVEYEFYLSDKMIG